jgi:hypothetical protein
VADEVFNIAKGRVVELYNRVESNDPSASALIVVLLKVAEVDSVLRDYDDLGTLIAAAGNTEADFTNYARKTLTDVELASLPAPDDVNDRYEVTIGNQVWASAGGATNNTLVKLLVCYDADTGAGTDSNILPLVHLGFAVSTNGANLTATTHANGFFRAA